MSGGPVAGKGAAHGVALYLHDGRRLLGMRVADEIYSTGVQQLGPGDMFLVPPDKPHSIQLLTEHVRLVDCFNPIRKDFLE